MDNTKKTNLDILDISWFSKLMETTSIPILKPALPAWVSSCLEKAKILGADNSFGTPLDKDIEEVVKKYFIVNFRLRMLLQRNILQYITYQHAGQEFLLEDTLT